MTDLVRVTVAADGRRVDLAVPAVLPLVELVPELALHTGVGGRHDPDAQGLAVLTPGGQGLDPERSLEEHEVADGAVLVLAPRHEVVEPRYDDPAAALADAVERGVPGWPSGGGAAVALAGGASLLALSGVALAGWGTSAAEVAATAGGTAAPLRAVVVAAGATGALGLAAALAVRARRPAAGRVLAVASVWHGAAAGAVVGWSAWPALGPALLGAGVGALVAALVCLVGMPGHRLALLPGAVVALGGVGGGGALAAWPDAGAAVLSGGLVLAVVAATPLPRAALAAARAVRPGGPAQTDSGVDAAQVEAQALLAHRLVVAVEAGLGLVVAALAPAAVALGPAGTALALAAATTTLLRARRFRAAAAAAVGLLGGGAAVLLTAASVLVLHPGARGGVAGLLVAVALALAAVPALRPGPGWHRAADVVESLSLAALAPLLLAATGAHHRVSALVASLVGGG